MKRTGSRKDIFSKIVLIFGAVVVLGGLGWAVKIRVTGGWTEIIDFNDLQGGPGSDLISSYESLVDAVDIDITGAGNRLWQVDIRRVDTNWLPDFTLEARRTSSDQDVYGGTAYQQVTMSDQLFFYTDVSPNNARNIKVQYRLSGVSVQIPPGTYATTVYYTVTQR
jgi:hypothetical protein